METNSRIFHFGKVKPTALKVLSELTLFSLESIRSLIQVTKVGRILPMVISPEFRMGQYRDDDHREDAPHFISTLNEIIRRE